MARRSLRLNPHAPLVVDTRELGRQAGSLHRVARTVPAPPMLGVGLLAVPEGSTLELDLRLEAVVEGVLVTGRISGSLTGECGRCLDPVEDTFDVRFQELYAYGDGAQQREDPDEALCLVGDFLDLEPALRDAVVLSLPLTPLCSADCPGLCGQCGAQLRDDPAHTHDRHDPRWAGLQTLAQGQHEEEF
jgi:uncharacterized protein